MKKKHRLGLRGTFQILLLLFLLVAFLLIVFLTFGRQTRVAQEQAQALIAQKLRDVAQQIEILEESKQSALSLQEEGAQGKARAVDVIVTQTPALLEDTEMLGRLCEELRIEEIHIVNEEGRVISSSRVSHLGGSMPVSSAEMAYVEVSRLTEPGAVQIGFGQEVVQAVENAFSIQNLAPGFGFGQTGQVVVCEEEKVVAASQPGLLGEPFDQARVAESTEYFYVQEHFGRYQIWGFLAWSEIYAMRNRLFFALLFDIVLVYLGIFILLSVLVQKFVIDGIYKVNRSLQKITEGQLDERVEVHSNREFSLLSEGINTTVDALQRAMAEERARMDRELAYARDIQQAAMPQVFPPYPDRGEFEIYAFVEPAREVGGDFYDFFLLESGELMLLVADVSGKGIPAALFMMTAKTMIRSLVEAGLPLDKAIGQANAYLCANNDAAMFVTLWIGVIDLSRGALRYVNAGHNAPALGRKGQPYAWVRTRPNFVLGGLESTRYTVHEMRLEEGDMLFLYTDGVTEAANQKEELYGENRLLDCLSCAETRAPRLLCEKIRSDVEDFVEGAPQFDDITMLALYWAHPFEDKCRWEDEPVQCITIPAEIGRLGEVHAFVSSCLASHHYTEKTYHKILMAVEEIFVNIAQYAYAPDSGAVTILGEVRDREIILQFVDQGCPYNPMAKEDPDTGLSAAEREIGGLGIFLVKKSMDEISYERQGDKNILKIKKKLDDAP